jgi:hypothetical protein
LRPNKRFRVGATVLGTDYPIFTGWTEVVRPLTGSGDLHGHGGGQVRAAVPAEGHVQQPAG